LGNYLFVRNLVQGHKKKEVPSKDETPFAIGSSDFFSKQVFWLSDQPDRAAFP
jgi:hypothetical protein